MDLLDYDHPPAVGAIMTPFPYFVTLDDPVALAAELMAEHAIRHIPVKAEGAVVGMVLRRDLPPDAEATQLPVRDLLVPEPYTVDLTAPLHTVLLDMAERRVDTAIVLKGPKLAGIVTMTDVCRVLGELLEGRFGRSGDAA